MDETALKPPKRWLGMTKIAWWELGGIMFVANFSALFHFLFELSCFWRPMALFASVNESTWEHLKFYFWTGLLWTLLEYTYIRKDANNFWAAKAIGLIVTPLVICLGFYSYLGVALPKYGHGNLAADISVGVLGVIIGHIVSSRLMQARPLRTPFMRLAPVLLIVMIIMNATFTYFPPKMFLFEDFMGYEFDGKYGILDDYTEYRIFPDLDCSDS